MQGEASVKIRDTPTRLKSFHPMLDTPKNSNLLNKGRKKNESVPRKMKQENNQKGNKQQDRIKA